jgi:tricorn protease
MTFRLLAALSLLPLASTAAQRPSTTPALLSEPAISPDGLEIAFTSGGDIWTVPAAGGEARLLVSHPAHESRPVWSPDGSRLAFVSTRTGNGDIYHLTLATGELKRLTFDDASETLDGWSRDGTWVYFSTSSRDIAGMHDILRVRVDGGTPMPVSADRYASEYWAAPSPTDEGLLAFTGRGVASTQWWRRGHSHIDESEIWLLRREGGATRYQPVTEGGAKDMWPMWGPDGATIYFVRDSKGVHNIWATRVDCPQAARCGPPRQLTRYAAGRVLWPSITRDGTTIAFERDFRIHLAETRNGSAREVPISLRGAAAVSGSERLTLNNGFQWLSVAPDGRKVAFVARGEVFAAASRDAQDSERVTRTAGTESQLEWAPDSRRLAYISDREGASDIYVYDFGTRTEARLTSSGGSDVAPRWSPDGNSIAFIRGSSELRVVDVRSGGERRLASGYFGRFISPRSIAWSPDGRWIAFNMTGPRQFQNVHLVRASGGDVHQVTFLANVFGNSITWAPGGEYLLFDTGQRTEPGQVARVDLQPRLPRFREQQFRDLFTDPASPGPDTTRRAPATDTMPASRGARPAEVVLEGIRQRLTILPLGIDAGGITISPDGKHALFLGSAAGQTNVYTWSLDELAREQPVPRQVTSTSGNKGWAQWSPDSKEIWYLEGGRINAIALETRQARPLAVSAEIVTDFAAEKSIVMQQAWRMLAENFYDESFHGIDWGAIRTRYAPMAYAAATPDELRRALALMVGELNASHLGVSGPSFSPQVVTGRLGVRFDEAEYESRGRLKVTEVIPLGPAALSRGISVGSYILAVDGRRIDERTNLDELLTFTIDRRVALTVSDRADGGSPREVVLRPVNLSTEKGLLYRSWVESRRAYVNRMSGGRFGYVHMFDMGAPSLSQLYADLDTENYGKQGVVIDIRNNSGGFVNAYALDVFARRPYLNMTYRGFTPASARTVLGQRSLELPTVLVVNQHSLSDAEDFTEGYRALGLGKVVGEPTAGWIIYTSNFTLFEGTIVRVPFIRVTDVQGRDMELVPRPVDVHVKRPIGEWYTGRDSQLDAAIRALSP